ncbi:MAG: PhoH family protein [Pseudomonadota bacterium]
MNSGSERRAYVLDTNVLMHDPSCIFRFQEHDIFLPMIVLEELDNNKRGHSEVARNARQASRYLEDLIASSGNESIEQGIPLPTPESADYVSGRLFLQTREMLFEIPAQLPGNKADNTILSTLLALQEERLDVNVALVSKDINLRIKAAALGIRAEDYHSDQVLDDVTLLYKGYNELPGDFWATHSKEVESWQKEGRTYYKVKGDDVSSWHANQFIFAENNFEALVRSVKGNEAIIELIKDYRNPHHSVWGITARNQEQNFALNILMDPEIDFVTLLGMAGTGKTLLTLAAALCQVLEHKLYREIIMTRVTVPVGEDIGFLPGTEEEKMTPWMGALMDNLEVLTKTEFKEDWERTATHELLTNRIKIRSLNFMRGRTFLNKFLIIDEAQNLTPKQMKTLITRAGPGTKVVCLGNLSQIDTPYLSETTSGLTYVVDRFKQWEHSSHVTLTRGERSRLADYASEVL